MHPAGSTPEDAFIVRTAIDVNRRPHDECILRPAGSTPTRSFVTVIIRGVPQRSFSSTTAESTALWKFASTDASDAGSDDRMSTSIQPSNGIEFTDVPPPTRPTLNVVFGCLGT